MKYLKQVAVHPKFMLFLMFIKRIPLKMQSESEDHLGNYIFAPLLHHKKSIKQWNQLLSSRDNKMQLIDRIKNTNSNIFYVTTGTKCHNLSGVGMTEVSRLSTPQEEADTRMFLHAQYVLNHVQGNIIINSPDTDVFIISLIVSEKINANINFKIGNKDKKRIINVNKVKESLKDKYDAVVSVGLECLTRALASLHAFTGCDTVSAFSSFGKFKIMAKGI